jgi:hypothetical protein
MNTDERGSPFGYTVLFFSESSFYFFPNDSNELDAIPYLLSQWHRVCTEILCMSQSKGGYAASVLQPPVLRRLGVTRRCHMLAHLVEVVGLRLGCGDIQLLNVFRSDVDDLIDVLQRPLDKQEPGIRHE